MAPSALILYPSRLLDESRSMSQLFRLAPFWPVMLRELDLSAESLARRAGQPANLFASSPVMVDVAGWAALWNALEAEADDPLLPLRLGGLLTLDMFDPAQFAAFCSGHLQQAAARLQLYKRLLGPFRLELDDRSGLALSCRVEGLPHPPALLGAVELALWVGLGRHATRHPIRSALRCPFFPEHRQPSKPTSAYR